MSEIFNWLRKTEDERKKSAFISVPQFFDEPQEISPKPERLFVPFRALPSEGQLVNCPQFDISEGEPLISEMLRQGTYESEQYRFLRTKLSLRQKSQPLQKVLITSAAAEEGKTVTSCSLAGILAQEPGKRVVLIEADLRKPAAAKSLGCKNRGDRVGLCQVLRGEVAPADALLKASGMELYLLPSGGRPNNPVELLSSPNWELALRTLAASFDWVLVDSPPILGMADTMLLSALADFILLVIRSEFTPGSLIQEAVQRIGQEKISGIAMNRINKSRRARYYQYYAAYSSERQA